MARPDASLLRRAVAALAVVAAAAPAASAATLEEASYAVDGDVAALAVWRGRVIVGGDFTRIGAHGANLVVADAGSGALRGGPPAAVADGASAVAVGAAGTYYVAGVLPLDGGDDEPRIVRVRADGSLDPAFAWHGDSPPTAIARAGDVLYVALADHGLVALDAATGADTGWHAAPLGDTSDATMMAVTDAAVYVAGPRPEACDGGGPVCDGDPSAVQGRDRSSGAAVEGLPAATAGLALAATGGTVYGLARDAGDRLAWFRFDEASGETARWQPAALPAPTGAVSEWSPPVRLAGLPGGDVVGLAAEGGSLVVTRLAAGGASARWRTVGALDGRGAVPGLIVGAGRAFAIDGVASLGGRAAGGAAVVDLATGAARAWRLPRGRAEWTRGIADGDRVVVVGPSPVVGGVARASLAAIDAATGAVLRWSPRLRLGGAPGTVAALAADGGRLLVGGAFDHVGASRRAGLAALRPDGRPTRFAPPAGTDAIRVARTADAVWAVSSDDGTLMALDPWSGRLRARRYVADGGAIGGAIVGAGRTLYSASMERLAAWQLVGRTIVHRWQHPGFWTGAAPRANGGIAALRLDFGPTATLATLAPDGTWRRRPRTAMDWGDALASRDGRLWVLGATRVGSARRAGLAAFDARTGRLLPLRAAPFVWHDGGEPDAVLLSVGASVVALTRDGHHVEVGRIRPIR